ncbi:uncharacterized protein LOC117328671 [Pecten maximus]|uniref:uncharacterized protein LOC117328671 n=1 Tax=Pecten maximus TaxID=6579 RepID=UPI001457ED08|nr:uncharacterized protein LOC117328671 [Pecten maximus]
MSRSQFNDRILRGFVLSSDALFEIRQLLDRRQKTKFSEGLSPEARLALQQMNDDTRVKFTGDSDDNSPGEDDPEYSGRKGIQVSKKSPRKSGKDKSRRQISFTDSPRGLKGIKSNNQSKEVFNAYEINNSSSSERDVISQKDDVLTSDPNPVDKCREWVAGNDIETPAGT